jgi:hypothetical protein
LGGVVQEHENPKKKLKLELKVFFEVLKFLSLFSSILWVFLISFLPNIMGGEVGSGGKVIQEPECPNKSLRLSLPESC